MLVFAERRNESRPLDNSIGLLVFTEVILLAAVVYGDNFALYDERSFDKFVSSFYDRQRAKYIFVYL